jgi:hypothetical protein
MRRRPTPPRAKVVTIMRAARCRGSVKIQADPDGGGVRVFRVCGTFVFGAITMPSLTDADISRITLIQLLRPPADKRAEVEAVIERAHALHPASLPRLAGW